MPVLEKGTFAPPASPNERQEGCLLPSDPLSGPPDVGYLEDAGYQFLFQIQGIVIGTNDFYGLYQVWRK